MQVKEDEDEIEVGSARMSLKCPVSRGVERQSRLVLAHAGCQWTAVLCSHSSPDALRFVHAYTMLRSGFVVADERDDSKLDLPNV